MFKNLGPIRLFRFVSLAASLGLSQASGNVKVPDATAIRLSLSESLSSATNEVDDPVRFEVTEDVKVGEFIAIPKGSTAVGHVVEVEPRRRMGRAGKLNFSIDHVKAVDGSSLRVRASSTRKGDDRTGAVIIGTVIVSPLFLIMRGKDISIPKGSSLVAYVDGDREVISPQDRNLPAPAPVAALVSSVTEPASTALKTPELATVVVKSDPDGANISIDGKFVGDAPSTMQLPPGDHAVVIERTGFKPWQRSINLTPGGIVTLTGTLERP
jgi:hypothetical protein